MWSIITACVRVPVRPQSSSAVAGKCDGKLLPAPSSCPPGGQSRNHRACPHLPWTGARHGGGRFNIRRMM